MPFDIWIPPLSQLPTEIWERIIDWIGTGWEPYQFLRLNKTLCACTLVCRSWLHRAWLNLYRSFEISPKSISKFQAILRNNPSLSLTLAKTKSIVIDYSFTEAPQSALFTTSKLVNLKYLKIRGLDLTKEHSAIMRGLLSRSVTDLEFQELHSCPVSTFLRFLNSFHSLANLHVHLTTFSDSLSHNGQVLPFPRPIPGRCLNSLSFPLVPGADTLIEWYIREGSFLASLKKLELRWDNDESRNENRSCSSFESFRPLLDHCAGILEDLTINIHCSIDEGPTTNEIPSAGMFLCFSVLVLSPTDTDGALVVLSSLPKLRRLMWDNGYSKVIFQVTASQLGLITSPCKLVEEVIFLVKGHAYDSRVREHCKLIDEALASDKFPSLRRVRLYEDIPLDCFPILQSRWLSELMKE